MKIVYDVRTTAHTPIAIKPLQKSFQLIKSVSILLFILNIMPVIHEIAELNHIF